MRYEDAQYEALCETGAPPFFNAASSNEVADALQLLARSPEKRQKAAEAHRRWFLDNHSGARWWPEMQAILGALALGHRFSFEESPLNADLSAVGRLYPAEQLPAAPPFPQYEISISGFADIRGHPHEYPDLLDTATRALRVSESLSPKLAKLDAKLDARLAEFERIDARLAEFERIDARLAEFERQIAHKIDATAGAQTAMLAEMSSGYAEIGAIAQETRRIASGFDRRYRWMTAPLRYLLRPILRVLGNR